MASVVNLEAIKNASVSCDPYHFLVAPASLHPASIPDLRRDFPDIRKPGYLTVDEVALNGAFKTLIEELEGPELTEELSIKFGQSLHDYPRLTTIMKQSQPKYGAIHTDGDSKVLTMLIYLNDAWSVGEGGRLRVLYDGKNFEPFALEVPPTVGTTFAFLRSDNSWHGHLPFAGERRVVQVAWIKNAAELERKKKRNSTAQFLKGIFGK